MPILRRKKGISRGRIRVRSAPATITVPVVAVSPR
jgi:hypothetical protein